MGATTKRWLARAAIGLVLTLVGFCPQAGAAEPSKPLNVILILADDLGWADLGCYGSDLHETPHQDRLAKQGVRFTNACAAAPVCTTESIKVDKASPEK